MDAATCRNRVGLKGYKEHKALSEETIAYTTKITLDGKVIGDAKNDGQGGADMIYIAPEHRAEWMNIINALGIDEEALVQGVAEELGEKKTADKLFKKDTRFRVVVAAKTNPEKIGDLTFYGTTEFRAFVDPRLDDADIDRMISNMYGHTAPRRFYYRSA